MSLWHFSLQRVSQKFGNILLHTSLQHVCHGTKAIQIVEVSMMVVGALTCSASLHHM